jgi:uncharacterized surface anchored protein
LLNELASIEAAEASIDSFIERRARVNEAENAREMMWKASVRRHHDRIQEARLWDRLAYHRAMLDAHTQNYEELLRRHRVGLRLCEEALGIESQGGNAA